MVMYYYECFVDCDELVGRCSTLYKSTMQPVFSVHREQQYVCHLTRLTRVSNQASWSILSVMMMCREMQTDTS